MKTVAITMTLVILSVILLCPWIVCPQTTHSCCHKPALDCPYVILAKSKASPSVTHTPAIIPAAGVSLAAPVAPCVGITAEYRPVDSTGLFLRNRVLLI